MPKDKVKNHIRTFGEAVTPPPFYPDDPKVEISDLIGQELTIVAAVVVRDFKTKLGKSDFVLIRFTRHPRPDLFATTLCGGIVVVRKVQQAIDGVMLPLRGTVTRVESEVAGHSPYYDIN